VTAPSTSSSVIPGATSVVTGKPFLLEGIVAGLLALAGALLLLVRLRLRHR
jgi:cell division protein FtsX